MAVKTDRELLQETHDGVTEMTVMVKAHDRTLYGNGQPGLVDTVSRVDVMQQQCPARRARMGNAAITGIAAGAGGVVAGILRAAEWMIGR